MSAGPRPRNSVTSAPEENARGPPVSTTQRAAATSRRRRASASCCSRAVERAVSCASRRRAMTTTPDGPAVTSSSASATVGDWLASGCGRGLPPRVGAAVHDDGGAGDVGGGVRGQERDERRDLVGRPQPPQRDAVLPLRDALGAVLLEALAADRPGRDADGADAVAAPLQRQARRQHLHGGAGGGGVREPRDAAPRA